MPFNRGSLKGRTVCGKVDQTRRGLKISAKILDDDVLCLSNTAGFELKLRARDVLNSIEEDDGEPVEIESRHISCKLADGTVLQCTGTMHVLETAFKIWAVDQEAYDWFFVEL